VSKKLEQEYKKSLDEINEAIKTKNYPLFDQIMAHKMSIDSHVIGKGTIALYRSLFSFTNVVLMTVAN
jgi:hypothetical protein